MPETPNSPQKSKLTGTVQWDDGENFNGFVAAVLIVPTDGASDWDAIHTGVKSDPTIRVPLRFIINIVDGEYNTDLGLFYNEDLTPQNSQYVAYYYDATGKEIAGPTAQFSVTASETTISVPTLTAPIVGSTNPGP